MWLYLPGTRRELHRVGGLGAIGQVKAFADARRPPACLACERVASADARSVETIVGMSTDEGWAAVVTAVSAAVR